MATYLHCTSVDASRHAGSSAAWDSTPPVCGSAIPPAVTYPRYPRGQHESSRCDNKRRDTKVAIIGAGEIVRTAHLPAYRSIGIDICGVFDVNEDRARRLAREHGIHQYRSLGDLLGDPAASLVDIAVPPAIQAELVPRVVRAGKHVLAQKPLARSLREADAA